MKSKQIYNKYWSGTLNGKMLDLGLLKISLIGIISYS